MAPPGGGKNFKRPKAKKPKKAKIQTDPTLRSAAASTSSSARGTYTDTSSIRTLRRKVAVPIHTQNQFNISDGLPLSDIDDDMSAEEIILTRTKQNKNKVPPIVVVSGNHAKLHTLMQSTVASKKFTLKAMSVGTRIDIENNDELIAVKEALKGNGFQFYSYHSPSTKPLKFVLHGLQEMQPDALRQTLLELNITPEDIKMLNIKHKRYQDQAVYLLYFLPSSMTLAQLRKTKSIKNFAVKWDRYRPNQKSSVAQCRNCQMYGHSSVNCNMPSKCMVCAENHKTDACKKRIPRLRLKQQQQEKREQPDRSFIKCASCGGNHTANYFGCESRKKFIEAQSKPIQQRRVRFAKESGFRLAEHNFPSLGTISSTNPPLVEANNQPTWAQAIQGIKQEQSSLDTVLKSLQVMVESMNTLMNKMSQLVEALVNHRSGGQIK